MRALTACKSKRLMFGSRDHRLVQLTAVLLLGEVEWAGAGEQDQHHLVAHCTSHLQRNSDTAEEGES